MDNSFGTMLFGSKWNGKWGLLLSAIYLSITSNTIVSKKASCGG
jgi:hypothetical protein